MGAAPPGRWPPAGTRSVSTALCSPPGGHGHDRTRGRRGTERPEEGSVREVEGAAVLADHQVAIPEGDHAGDRLVEMPVSQRPTEPGIEGEDAAVGSDEPVSDAVGVRHHGLYGRVQSPATHRTPERGVTK